MFLIMPPRGKLITEDQVSERIDYAALLAFERSVYASHCALNPRLSQREQDVETAHRDALGSLRGVAVLFLTTAALGG